MENTFLTFTFALVIIYLPIKDGGLEGYGFQSPGGMASHGQYKGKFYFTSLCRPAPSHITQNAITIIAWVQRSLGRTFLRYVTGDMSKELSCLTTPETLFNEYQT